MTLNNDFEDALHRLEEARIADEELHRQDAPLQERVASHDLLVAIRAEIAQLRTSVGTHTFKKTGQRS